MNEMTKDIVVGIAQLETLGELYRKHGNSILKNGISYHIHRGNVVLDVPYFNQDEKEVWYFCISRAGGYTERKSLPHR